MGKPLWVSVFLLLLLSQGGVWASDLSEYHYAAATIKWQAGDLQGCLADLWVAASEDPNNPDIQLLLGRVLLQTKEVNRALAALQKAVDLDPQGAEAPFYLALACSDSGDLQRALLYFEKARTLDPSLTQVCLYREGIALLQLNSRSVAREKFEEARRIDPESVYGRSAQDYLRLLQVKCLNLSATAGIEWDSNVILKPEEGTYHYHLPKKSDWSVPILLAAEYRPWTGSKGVVGLRYNFYQNLHFRLHDYDVTNNAGEVFAAYNWGPLSIRPHYRYEYTQLHWNPFSQVHEGGLDLYIPETASLSLQPFYRYQYRDFLYPINPENDRDGSFHQAGAFQYLYFSEGKSYFRLGGLYERDFPEGKNYDEVGGKAMAGFRLHLPLSMTFNAEGEYGRLFFRQLNTLFHRHRTDTLYSYYLQLRKDFLWGLSASVRFTHLINDSTIKDFEYHRTISSLFLSWNF
jgi:tetratricopeptide (TPR) repeat protein